MGASDILKELIAEEEAQSASDSEDERNQEQQRNNVAAYDLESPS
jgi:hypothetical protein